MVLAYLWEVLLGKSCLARIRGSWGIHMGLSVVIPALVLLLAPYGRGVFRARGSVSGSRRRISYICIIIFAWGCSSAAAQEHAFAELAFVGAWAAMIAASWWVLPKLVSGVPTRLLVRSIAIPLKLGVLASLVALLLGFDSGSRFRGCFYTSPAAAEVFVLTAVFSLAEALTDRKGGRRLVNAFLVALSVFCVVLTRSRGAMLICATVLTAMWLYRSSGVRKLEKGLSVAALVLVLALASAYGVDEQRYSDVATYSRFEGGIIKMFYSRAKGYRNGVNAIRERPLFGSGFTSRFTSGGGIGYADRQAGRMSKTYTFVDDPHLMVLTLGKSIGLVGVFLGLALLFEFARIGLTAGRATGARDPLGRILIFGLCVYVLADSLETNMLLSFGRIADRFAIVTIAVLSCRRDTFEGETT
ncbi:MAG: O-antigen ligase family protein [Planctomycetota bacterium]|jgi:hypothetical protein